MITCENKFDFIRDRAIWPDYKSKWRLQKADTRMSISIITDNAGALCYFLAKEVTGKRITFLAAANMT